MLTFFLSYSVSSYHTLKKIINFWSCNQQKLSPLFFYFLLSIFQVPRIQNIYTIEYFSRIFSFVVRTWQVALKMLLFRVAFVIAIIACIRVKGDLIFFGIEYKMKVMEYTDQEKSLDTIGAATESLKKFITASATVAAAGIGIAQPVLGAIISLFPLIMELATADSSIQTNEILANEFVHIRSKITTIRNEAQSLNTTSKDIQHKPSILHDMYREVDEMVNYFADIACPFRKRPLIAIAPLAAIAPLTTISDTFQNISEPETVYLKNITTRFREVLDQYKKLAVKYRLEKVVSAFVLSTWTAYNRREFDLTGFIDDLANERDISLPKGHWPYVPITDDCNPKDTGYYIVDPIQEKMYCTFENGENTVKLYLVLLDCKVNRVFNEIERMTFISQVKEYTLADNNDKFNYNFYRNKNGIPC